MRQRHLIDKFILAGEANQEILKALLSPNPLPKYRIDLIGSEEQFQEKSVYFVLQETPLPWGLFSQQTLICLGKEVLETVMWWEDWDTAAYGWSQTCFNHRELPSEGREGNSDPTRIGPPFHVSYSCVARSVMIVAASEHPDEIYLRASQDDDVCLRAADCMASAWRTAATNRHFNMLRYILMTNIAGETCNMIRKCHGDTTDGFVGLSPQGTELSRDCFNMFSGSPYGRCVYDLLIRYWKEFKGKRVKRLLVYSKSQLGPSMANTTGGLWGPTLVWELEPSKGDDLES